MLKPDGRAAAADEYPCKVGSIVNEMAGWEGPEKWMDKKDAKRVGRYVHFAMAASKLALEEAKIDMTKENKDAFGVIIGSGGVAGGFGGEERASGAQSAE